MGGKDRQVSFGPQTVGFWCKRRHEIPTVLLGLSLLLGGLIAAAIPFPLVIHAHAQEQADNPQQTGDQAGGFVFQRTHATVLTAKAGAKELDLEFAQTPQELARGLMFRTELQAGQGMLFDFRPARIVRMWMKNTLIPLDMIYFDPQGQVVYRVLGAQPGDLTPVGPDQPVAAVLELAAGQADAIGIAIGDRLIHPMFENPPSTP